MLSYFLCVFPFSFVVIAGYRRNLRANGRKTGATSKAISSGVMSPLGARFVVVVA
jgi:hypothetical protein